MKSSRKGNVLLSVHINFIKGRDQQTKARGPNPLRHLGVTFSDSGSTATLWETDNGNLKEYADIDGAASYQTGGVQPQYWGKSVNLAQWYREYDWVANNDYHNFSTWVG